jgi:8-oxo-dGTP pyrophosphatase MutT (NUDIX family)
MIFPLSEMASRFRPGKDYNSCMRSEEEKIQTSAGGVAYRRIGNRTEVTLISVGLLPRWQLPKGMVDPGEQLEQTAVRELREEAGVVTQLLAPIDTIDYWFTSAREERRTSCHKFVHYYLLRYLSGDPEDHDDEVNEACWVEIGQAFKQLTFDNEKEVVQKAMAMLAASSE